MSKGDPNTAQQKDGKVGQDGKAGSISTTRSTLAHQVARAASAHQHRVAGQAPKAVTVVLGGDTLVISLHEALSPAERELSKSPAGAAQVQEFHRQLFASSAAVLREEIRRITGVEVREAAAEVETATGTVVHVFTTGTMVQVFLLDGLVADSSWSGTEPGNE